jgi:hypothetical protein
MKLPVIQFSPSYFFTVSGPDINIGIQPTETLSLCYDSSNNNKNNKKKN